MRAGTCGVLVAVFAAAAVQVARASVLPHNFTQERESAIRELAAKIADVYSTRCPYLAQGNITCSYSAASSDLPNVSCDANFVTNEAVCGSCLGNKRSHSASSVRLAPTSAPEARVAEDVAWTRLVEPLMMKTYDAVPGAHSVWMTTVGGVHRVYPGDAQRRNGDSDGRLSSHYAAALSGQKALLVMLDHSNSMSYDGVWGKARSLADNIVSMLGARDWGTVVPFNDGSRNLAPSGSLNRTSPEALYTMRGSLCTVTSSGSGGTLFKQALRRAYNAIRDWSEDNGVTNCEFAVVLITDGENRERFNDLYPALRNLQGRLSADGIATPRVFTYSLTQYSKEGRLRAISCYTGGAHVHIQQGTAATADQLSVWNDQIHTALRIAQNATGKQPDASWSALEKFSTFNSSVLTSVVSYPVYAIPGNTLSELLGVVSLRIALQDVPNLTSAVWEREVLFPNSANGTATFGPCVRFTQCSQREQDQLFRATHPGVSGGKCSEKEVPSKYFGTPATPINGSSSGNCTQPWYEDIRSTVCDGFNYTQYDTDAQWCNLNSSDSSSDLSSYQNRTCCKSDMCELGVGTTAGRTAAETRYIQKCPAGSTHPALALLAACLLAALATL